MNVGKTNPIFIGGTARSGTSILYSILSQNDDIFAFPKEMRFIVDNEGLINLVNSLTDIFSPVIAREAIFRFERLMKFYLTTPHISPYPSFNLTKYIDKDFYFEQIDAFLSKLYHSEYQGINWQIEDYSRLDTRLIRFVKLIEKYRYRLFKDHDLQFGYERKTIVMPKYFENKNDLYRITADFINKLFMSPTYKHGKKIWCEKTPFNILHIDFLWHLFPDAIIIHIKRDPRSVIHSFTNKKFYNASNIIDDNIYLLQEIYKRWAIVKAKIKPNNYLEIKLEDFVEHPEYYLKKIAKLCNVSNKYNDISKLSKERAEDWKKTMDKSLRKKVEEKLENYFELMDYEI